jgi:hypothetical protein
MVKDHLVIMVDHHRFITGVEGHLKIIVVVVVSTTTITTIAAHLLSNSKGDSLTVHISNRMDDYHTLPTPHHSKDLDLSMWQACLLGLGINHRQGHLWQEEMGDCLMIDFISCTYFVSAHCQSHFIHLYNTPQIISHRQYQILLMFVLLCTHDEQYGY